MNRRTPISVRSLMYSKTQWNVDYLHVLYAFFRTLPFSFGYTEMEITKRRGEVVWWLYTLDLIKAFLARHVKIFEVASWHQCFADQQGGFWKEKKDWTALWRLILGKITQKVKFLYKHIEFCFLLWPESICFPKFVTKVKWRPMSATSMKKSWILKMCHDIYTNISNICYNAF